jgi:hypothetical protein
MIHKYRAVLLQVDFFRFLSQAMCTLFKMTMRKGATFRGFPPAGAKPVLAFFFSPISSANVVMFRYLLLLRYIIYNVVIY